MVSFSMLWSTTFFSSDGGHGLPPLYSFKARGTRTASDSEARGNGRSGFLFADAGGAEWPVALLLLPRLKGRFRCAFPGAAGALFGALSPPWGVAASSFAVGPPAEPPTFSGDISVVSYRPSGLNGSLRSTE